MGACGDSHERLLQTALTLTQLNVITAPFGLRCQLKGSRHKFVNIFIRKSLQWIDFADQKSCQFVYVNHYVPRLHAISRTVLDFSMKIRYVSRTENRQNDWCAIIFYDGMVVEPL